MLNSTDTKEQTCVFYLTRALHKVGVRLAQKVQTGPCIPVGMQLYNAEVGPTAFFLTCACSHGRRAAAASYAAIDVASPWSRDCAVRPRYRPANVPGLENQPLVRCTPGLAT